MRDGPVRLRRFREDDAPALVRACRDPAIARWLPHIPQPYELKHALAYIRGDAIPDETSFAITVDGALAGAIGMSPTGDRISRVGYWCAKEHRGRGHTTRALRLIARHAFDDLHIERLELIAEPENEASQRVAKKAGFEPEARRQPRRRDHVLAAAAYASSRAGKPNSGNSRSVDRKNVSSTMRPAPSSSSTCSAHGS